MNIILRIIISAVVAFALSYILSGVHIQSFVTALDPGHCTGSAKPVCKTHPDHSHFTYYHIYFWPFLICHQCPDHLTGCKICERIPG